MPLDIYSDGAAYYAYLPYWFIYDTKDFSFLQAVQKKYPDKRYADNVHLDNERGVYLNKYYPGTAVLISPFFFIAHGVEKISERPADGYSYTYRLFVSIAAIFYWLAGSIALYLLLLNLKLPRYAAVIAIITITFGTNLFYYVVYAPSYSHVYSFACVSWMIFVGEKWVRTDKSKHLLILGILLGLAFIIRPTNVLGVLIIPFFFTSFKAFIERVKTLFTQKITTLLAAVFLMTMCVIFHLWNFSLITGEWRLNTYTDEGFDYLTSPYICEVLFSVRRGLFLYAPALLVSFFGLFFLYKKRRNLFWGFLLTFGVFTYITASWWCWWYGGGFSMRPYVDIMAIFGIPLAILLSSLNPYLKAFTLFIILGCIYLTQIFSYQLSRNILHYDGVNWNQFKEVFLKTDTRFEWHVFLDFDTIPKNYQEIGQSINFYQYEKKISDDVKIVSTENYEDDLSLKLYTPSQSNDYFAARIKGQFKLSFPYTKPFYRINYFKKDSEIIRKEIFISGKIPYLNEWTTVSVDLFPQLKMDELDSVEIVLSEGSTQLRVKELGVKLLKKTSDH